MKMISLILAVFFALTSCGGGSPRVTPVKPMEVSTVEQLVTALATAETKHNITIRFTADIVTKETVNVRGTGTVVDLGGHTFSYDGHFTGVTGGCGMAVGPALSDLKPIDGNHKAIITNPNGSVAKLNLEQGSSNSWFTGEGPCQYADEPLRDVYTLQRDILVPAEKITIKNGKIVCIDSQAFRGMYVDWSRNVICQNLAFAYPVAIITNLETGASNSTNVTFTDCDLGGYHLAFNGTYNVTVTRCTNGNTTFEERARKALVQNCNLVSMRVNDATCEDFRVLNNTFTNPDGNYGCIALYEIGGTQNLFQGNTLEGCGIMWTGMMGKGATLTATGNTGWDFYKYWGPRGITDTDNAWSNPGRQVSP